MIESEIRGGTCRSILRHRKANQKDIESYYQSKDSSYLVYLDANNLHDSTIFTNITCKWFKWVQKSKFYLKNVHENSKTRCFLQFDLKYPQQFGWSHNELPVLPRKMKVNKH